MAWLAKGTSGYLLAILHSFYRQRGESMIKYTKKVVKKSSQKMVEFLTQVEESRLKIT
jgi:hypothetical protein